MDLTGVIDCKGATSGYFASFFANKQRSRKLIKRSINRHCSHTYCENNMTLAFVKCTAAEDVLMRRTRNLMDFNSEVEIQNSNVH